MPFRLPEFNHRSKDSNFFINLLQFRVSLLYLSKLGIEKQHTLISWSQRKELILLT